MKAIIFDLDGTLLNTLDDLTDSTNYALSLFGYKTRTIQEIRSFVGNGVRLLIERAVPKGANVDKVLEAFKAHYAEHSLDKTLPYPHIAEMLESVSSYKTAIVSNKFDVAVQTLKNRFFPSITAAVGESPDVNKKPAPDMVFKALDLLKVSPSEAVFVGDSDVDMQTAINSNMKKIAVTWGFRSREVLQSFSPDAIIDDPLSLKQVVDCSHRL